MSDRFVPDVWHRAMLDRLERAADRSRSIWASLTGPVRESHLEPLPEAMKRQYTDFEQRWNAILAEGEAKGFLVWYREEGPVATEPAGVRVFDESEEDFAVRRAEWEAGLPKGPVTFPVRGSDDK